VLLRGAESNGIFPEIQQIFLPLEELARGPATDLEPMPLSEFEALLQAARPAPRGPAGAALIRAEYAATLVDSTLRDGHFTLGVARTGAQPQMVSLEPLNLAVAHVGWKDGPAVWGRTPRGETELLVDRAAGELVGEWELRGRRLARSIEFDFQGAAATVSRLQLRLPDSRTLTCAGGEVVTSEPAPEAGWTIWRIELGSRARSQISIALSENRAAPEPLTLVRQESVYAVRQEGLRLIADFHLEVLQGAVQEFEFALDPDIQVFSVTHGSEVALPWDVTENEDGRRLTVTLPDPLTGQGRPLRLRGISTVKVDQDWSLPRIRLKHAVLSEGDVSLRIQPPLELKSLRRTGYRQTEIESVSSEEESIRFRQFQADGGIAVVLGNPTLKLSARVSTDVQTSKENWTALSQIEWTSRAGNAFTLQCRIPDDWEITDVRSDPMATQSDLSSWDVVSQADRSRWLVLNLLESLSPDRAKRVEISARRLPIPPDQTTSVPAFEPVGVDDVEMLVSIAADPVVRPVLEPGTSFDPVKPEDLPPVWSDSEFWKPRLATRTAVPLLLQLKDLTADGEFYLQSLQTPVDVAVEIVAELGRERLTETFQLHVSPQHGRTERVLIYTGDAGPALSWAWLTEGQKLPLDAKRLPAGRHAAWDLPLAGELWEVRLPAPQAEPFTISGYRTRGVPAQGRIGLAFVPQANEFRGSVEIRTAAGAGVELRPHELQRVGGNSGAAGDQAAPDERTNWTYATTSAQLAFQIPDDPTALPPVAISRLTLLSQLTLDAHGFDIHWAEFDLGPAFKKAEFAWELPAPAALMQTQLDGQRVTPAQQGSAFVVSGLSSSENHVVRMQYRHPRGANFGRWGRELNVPRVAAPVLRFDWQFALPPGARLAGPPTGLVLTGPQLGLSGMQRLFGPLGRGAETPLFNPFRRDAWSRLAAEAPVEAAPQPSPPAPSAVVTGSLAAELPAAGAGWQIWTAVAPTPPARIDLEIWDARQAQLLAWSGLLGCVVIGVGVRLLKSRNRGRLGALWLGTCVLLALSLPPVSAQIAGGCLVGTLLVTLFPRAVISRARARSESQPQVPVGSTQTFHHAPGTFVMLLGLAGAASSVWGQDPSEAARAPISGEPPAAARAAQAFRVFIPVDEKGLPAGAQPIVYVPPRLLEKLQALREANSAFPDYLISAADYVGAFDTEGGLLLRAQYEVHVLRPSATVPVEFPLANVNLGGPDACLVDGQTHPALNAPRKKGFLIFMAGPVARSPLAGETAAVADKPAVAKAQRPSVSHRVALRLYPLVANGPTGGSVQLDIPAVADSRLALEFAEPQRSLELPDCRGAVRIAETGHSATASIGSASELRITWAKGAPAPELPAKVEAAASCLVDVQPTLLQFRYRIACRVVQGKVGSLTWHLPRGIGLRSVTAPGLLHFSLHAAGDDQCQLQLEFGQPHVGDFLVALDFCLPNEGGPDAVNLPPLRLTGDVAGEPEVRLTLHQIGIRGSSEYQIEATSEFGEHLSSLAIDSFLENWGPETSKPQFAYRLLDPVGLKFGMRSLGASRIVRTNQIVGWIGSRKLNWSQTAVIEVQTAKAFQHRLQVDPRLRITSVSVQEDGANRLLRWSRMGDQLYLFLRDKTTGTQTITLTGTLPLQVPQEVELPRVRFLDATVSDARMALYQDAELAVDFLDGSHLERLEPTPLERDGAGHGLLIGVFQVPSEPPRLVIRTSRNVPELDCRSVTVLQARESRWKITTSLVFRVRQGHGSHFLIRIPAELPQFEIEAAGVRQLQEKDPDGSVKVSLLPSQPVRERFHVNVTASVNIPVDTLWKLPEIVALNATLEESYLVLVPPDAAVVAEPRISGLRAADLPADLRPQLPPAELGGGAGKSYQGIARPWQVTLPPKLSTEGAAGISLVDSRIWLAPDFSRTGQTTLVMLPSDLETLELRMPAGTTVRAVVLDGQFATFKMPANDRLSIPLNAPQLGQAVTVFWSGPSVKTPRIANRLTTDLPEPLHVPIHRTLLSALPPAEYRIQSETGLAPLSALDSTLERLEALAQLVRTQADAGQNLSDPAWNLLLVQVHALLQQAERFVTAEAPLTTPRQDRFERLQALVFALPDAPRQGSPAPPGASTPGAVMPIMLTDFSENGPQSLVGQVGPDAQPRFWLISGRLWNGLWASLACLGVWLVGFYLVRWQAADWLHRHPAPAWCLLALLWWLWLSPAWLSLVLLGMAGFKLLGWLGTPPRQVPPPSDFVAG
jgi:hypothetical protein